MWIVIITNHNENPLFRRCGVHVPAHVPAGVSANSTTTQIWRSVSDTRRASCRRVAHSRHRPETSFPFPAIQRKRFLRIHACRLYPFLRRGVEPQPISCCDPIGCGLTRQWRIRRVFQQYPLAYCAVRCITVGSDRKRCFGSRTPEASFYEMWRVRFTFAENSRRQNWRLAEPSRTVTPLPGDIRGK